ncbi:MAG: universal stress protein [Xanthomonadaceae bacterium]|jgi:nucleotide-binding universal stress UspA family protein|nr:universal stress protein [Xanthomonadaceae bacterium]
MPVPMHQTRNHVLGAIDLSPYAISVADCAAWAASRMDAPLELLNIADRETSDQLSELRGGLSQERSKALLDELINQDEEHPKPLGKQHGRALLQALYERIAEQHGLHAQVRQRKGSIPATLLEVEDEVRLFVLGKRGENADFAKGTLGSKLEESVRSLHRPILVASRNTQPIKRFMIAFDGSPSTRKCVETVSTSPLLKGLECLLVMSADNADSKQQMEMDWAQQRLRQAGFRPMAWIVNGDPKVVIAQQIDINKINLLVMGAYGHSRFRNMFVGSTTTQILQTCLIPVLLIRDTPN